jgi:23S rRNA pseudouridine1911/1915/1917 synthase
MLHAMILGFVHPSTGEYMEFRAELPEYFTDNMRRLGIGTSFEIKF